MKTCAATGATAAVFGCVAGCREATAHQQRAQQRDRTQLVREMCVLREPRERQRGARHRHVLDDEALAVEAQLRLGVAEEVRHAHPCEVLDDEREEMDAVLERRSVALEPQIRLIDAVAALPHVDRLDARLHRLELVAPGRVVADAVAEREGIARAHDARAARRRCARATSRVPRKRCALVCSDAPGP